MIARIRAEWKMVSPLSQPSPKFDSWRPLHAVEGISLAGPVLMLRRDVSSDATMLFKSVTHSPTSNLSTSGENPGPVGDGGEERSVLTTPRNHTCENRFMSAVSTTVTLRARSVSPRPPGA